LYKLELTWNLVEILYIDLKPGGDFSAYQIFVPSFPLIIFIIAYFFSVLGIRIRMFLGLPDPLLFFLFS
jgi:hypothetical protein